MRPRPRPRPAHPGGDVALDGALAQAELLGNLLVDEPGGHEPEDLKLPRRKGGGHKRMPCASSRSMRSQAVA